jgi:hypothetical protein
LGPKPRESKRCGTAFDVRKRLNFVVAGLIPAFRGLLRRLARKKDVDAQQKAGHEGVVTRSAALP